MNLIDPIIGEFTHETANTRRMLERVPAIYGPSADESA